MGEFLIGLIMVIAVLGITGVLRQQFEDNAFVIRFPMAAGGLIALVSLWLPWLGFDILGILPFDDLKRFLAELGIGLIQALIDFFGNDWLEYIASVLGQEMSGWFVATLMPSTAILPRIVIGLVFFTGIGVLIVTGLSFIPNPTFCKIICGGTVCWSLLLTILLLLQFPEIDAWGTHNTFWQGLGVAILGVRLSWGAWVGFFGVVLGGVGSAIVLAPVIDNQ